MSRTALDEWSKEIGAFLGIGGGVVGALLVANVLTGTDKVPAVITLSTGGLNASVASLAMFAVLWSLVSCAWTLRMVVIHREKLAEAREIATAGTEAVAAGTKLRDEGAKLRDEGAMYGKNRADVLKARDDLNARDEIIARFRAEIDRHGGKVVAGDVVTWPATPKLIADAPTIEPASLPVAIAAKPTDGAS